jgi:hypothetical protein
MAPDELKICNNQPKTRGHDGGGIGYEARPSGRRVMQGGDAFDRSWAVELGVGVE